MNRLKKESEFQSQVSIHILISKD